MQKKQRKKEFKEVDAQYLEDIFREKDPDKKAFFAGRISVQPKQSSEPGEKESGHTLFFQYSFGKMRFHDSGALFKRHFFDFNTKKTFFEGIVAHLQKNWSKFNEGTIRFYFYSFPQEAEGPTL